jgi:hypothetical protein
MEKAAVFEKTYRHYLSQVVALDFPSLQDKLGVQATADEVVIPFFGTPYRVSAAGITAPSGKPPHLSISVILCKYLLMCPPFMPKEDDWVSYRDFKDAAPLIHSFANTVLTPVAESFCGRLPELQAAGKRLGGYLPAGEYAYDLKLQFDALPKVPLLLLFNDSDEEFPAQCTLLFERRTEKYLDMECLAMVGMLFSEYLRAEIE